MSIQSGMDGHGRMLTTEWSFPRSTLPPQKTSKQQPWTRWTLIILGIVSIVVPPSVIGLIVAWTCTGYFLFSVDCNGLNDVDN